MADWRDHITADPDILVGKPIIKGTRISVELILGRLANGWSFEQILESYPHITREDILAASNRIGNIEMNEIVFLVEEAPEG
jgi:uncharacterized protein (DUF433 family)